MALKIKKYRSFLDKLRLLEAAGWEAKLYPYDPYTVGRWILRFTHEKFIDCYCPVSACAVNEGYEQAEPKEWRSSAKKIHLKHRRAVAIVNAADDERRSSRVLRKAMLDVFSLTEPVEN